MENQQNERDVEELTFERVISWLREQPVTMSHEEFIKGLWKVLMEKNGQILRDARRNGGGRKGRRLNDKGRNLQPRFPSKEMEEVFKNQPIIDNLTNVLREMENSTDSKVRKFAESRDFIMKGAILREDGALNHPSYFLLFMWAVLKCYQGVIFEGNVNNGTITFSSRDLPASFCNLFDVVVREKMCDKNGNSLVDITEEEDNKDTYKIYKFSTRILMSMQSRFIRVMKKKGREQQVNEEEDA